MIPVPGKKLIGSSSTYPRADVYGYNFPEDRLKTKILGVSSTIHQTFVKHKHTLISLLRLCPGDRANSFDSVRCLLLVCPRIRQLRATP